MKLRHWQSECATSALHHYHTNNQHFFCLATPGAGKSIMAAEVAKRLLETKEIDFILLLMENLLLRRVKMGRAKLFSNIRFILQSQYQIAASAK